MKGAVKPLALVILLLALAASGCGSIGSYFGSAGGGDEAQETPANVLANEAEEAFRDGDYDKAADLFQALKDRYPYGRYGLLADLRVGDAYYRAARFDEAAIAYEDFVRLHPRNEAVPYALFRMGTVHHSQMLTPDRDPSSARKAVQAFERLLRSYPTSEWAAKARPRLLEAQHRLAEHDLLVGQFYFNTKNYRAAAGRFRRVVKDYPDVGLYGRAMNLLQKCRVELAKRPAGEREGADYERRDLLAPPSEGDRPTVLERDDTGGRMP